MMRKNQIYTVAFQNIERGKNVLQAFENVFHVYLMRRLQKYAKKNLHEPFLR